MDFPSFITSNLDKDDFKQINDNIDWKELSYTDSMIFDKRDKNNKIKKDVRTSSKAIIRDKKFFDLCDDIIVKKINVLNKNFYFKLQRDEVEIIKYDKGGYFKKHHDFVKYYSNQIKCYSLLLCLDGTCNGGETILYVNDSIIKLKESITNGGIILFRNEIEHEGSIVKDGYKIILKLNLLGLRKVNNIHDNNNEYVIIKFKNNENNGSYVLSKDIINKNPKSYFYANIDFNNDDGSNIIELDNISFEEFDPAYNCMINNISFDDYEKHHEIINFFGIEYKHENLFDISQKLYSKMLQSINNKINDFKQKMTKAREYIFVDNMDDYFLIKSIKSSSIVPFQIISSEYTKIFLIGDGIPIYYELSDGNNSILYNRKNTHSDEFNPRIKLLNDLINSSDFVGNRNDFNKYTNDSKYSDKNINEYATKYLPKGQDIDSYEIVNLYNVVDLLNDEKYIMASNEINYSTCVMMKLIEKLEYEYSDYCEGGTNTAKYYKIIDNFKVNYDKKYIDELNNKINKLGLIDKIVYYDYDDLNHHIKTDRKVGAYECNEVNYYEIEVHLDIGFMCID